MRHAPQSCHVIAYIIVFLRWLFGLSANSERPPCSANNHGRATMSTDEPLPYRATTHLLSQGERAFWFPLYQAVNGKYRIFAKVRLADVISIPPGPRHRSWFGKIKGYHVDFLLVDPETTRPLLAIELDDRSHGGKRQAERDAFKDRVLNAARVPLLRVRAQQAYDPIELRKLIDDHRATAAAWDRNN